MGCETRPCVDVDQMKQDAYFVAWVSYQDAKCMVCTLRAITWAQSRLARSLGMELGEVGEMVADVWEVSEADRYSYSKKELDRACRA